MHLFTNLGGPSGSTMLPSRYHPTFVPSATTPATTYMPAAPVTSSLSNETFSALYAFSPDPIVDPHPALLLDATPVNVPGNISLIASVPCNPFSPYSTPPSSPLSSTSSISLSKPDYQFRAIPRGLPISPTSFYSKYSRVLSPHPSLPELLPVDSFDDDFLIDHSNLSVESTSSDIVVVTPYPTSSNFVTKKNTLLNHVFSRVICLSDPVA